MASIKNVYVNGVMFEGGHHAMLVGGKGYGKDSLPGKINNIHTMNIMGDGQSLIQIEEPVFDCSFINGVYRGTGKEIIVYRINKNEAKNIISRNLIRVQ